MAVHMGGEGPVAQPGRRVRTNQNNPVTTVAGEALERPAADAQPLTGRAQRAGGGPNVGPVAATILQPPSRAAKALARELRALRGVKMQSVNAFRTAIEGAENSADKSYLLQTVNDCINDRCIELSYFTTPENSTLLESLKPILTYAKVDDMQFQSQEEFEKFIKPFSNLKILVIKNEKNIESIPDQVTKNLQELDCCYCVNLKAPQTGMQYLSSVKCAGCSTAFIAAISAFQFPNTGLEKAISLEEFQILRSTNSPPEQKAAIVEKMVVELQKLDHAEDKRTIKFIKSIEEVNAQNRLPLTDSQIEFFISVSKRVRSEIYSDPERLLEDVESEAERLKSQNTFDTDEAIKNFREAIGRAKRPCCINALRASMQKNTELPLPKGLLRSLFPHASWHS